MRSKPTVVANPGIEPAPPTAWFAGQGVQLAVIFRHPDHLATLQLGLITSRPVPSLAGQLAHMLGQPGLSTNTPTSVFHSTDRGSELNEPINDFCRSKIIALLCRLSPSFIQRTALQKKGLAYQSYHEVLFIVISLSVPQRYFL